MCPAVQALEIQQRMRVKQVCKAGRLLWERRRRRRKEEQGGGFLGRRCQLGQKMDSPTEGLGQ